MIEIAECRHCSARRLGCATPAMLTSAMLVTIAFSWLRKFTLLGLTGWLLAALLTLPSLERTAIRIATDSALQRSQTETGCAGCSARWSLVERSRLGVSTCTSAETLSRTP